MKSLRVRNKCQQWVLVTSLLLRWNTLSEGTSLGKKGVFCSQIIIYHGREVTGAESWDSWSLEKAVKAYAQLNVSCLNSLGSTQGMTPNLVWFFHPSPSHAHRLNNLSHVSLGACLLADPRSCQVEDWHKPSHKVLKRLTKSKGQHI